MDARLFPKNVQPTQATLSEEDKVFLKAQLDKALGWQYDFQEELDDLSALAAKHRRQQTLYCVPPEQKEHMAWLEVCLSECKYFIAAIQKIQNEQPITITEQKFLLNIPMLQGSCVMHYQNVIAEQADDVNAISKELKM